MPFFFGSDPKSATKTLDAHTISKVQVFNEKSEQAKLTGVEDGKKEKAMNLELKEEFKKGSFGKLTGAIGTANRWAARGNYNRFNAKEQFSILGFGNNINQTGVNWEDYGEFKGQNTFNNQDNGDFGFSSGPRRFYRMEDDIPFNNLYFTPTVSKYEASEESAEPNADDNYSWRKELFFMKRDFDKNTMTDAIEHLGKNYLIEDEIQPIEWKIQNDLKEVAGHICMKAVTEDTLKNQKMVAWFAQDIPIKAGPDQFSGLPGMILEVDINDGAMNITANKIILKKLTTELDLPKKIKSKKIKNEAYRNLVKTYILEKRKEEAFPFWGIRY